MLPTSAIFLLLAFSAKSSTEPSTQSDGSGKTYHQCLNGSLVEDDCQCEEMVTMCRLQPCLTRTQSIQRRFMCDGIFDCEDLSDECLCDRRTEENMATYDVCSEIFSSLLSPRDNNCPPGLIACKTNFNGMKDNISCLKTNEICDKIDQCSSVVDEMLCRRRRETLSKHRQEPEASLDLSAKQYFSCENRTNFIIKPVENVTVFDTGYSKGKWLWIDWRRRFDGVADCEDISDEWHPNFVYCGDNGTDIIITRCPETIGGDRLFASPENLIESLAVCVFEWLIGIAAFIGNFTLAVYSLLCIFRGKDHHRSEESNLGSSNTLRRSAGNGRATNHILVLFLCLGDLIMSIQIIMMVSANEYYRGKYWKYDEIWLSSLTCSAVGSLAMFSTQASSFMIVLISLVRLYVVTKPFKAVTVKFVVLASISTYVLAAIFMFIPLMTFIEPAEKYFIHSAYLPNLPQVDATVLERNKAEEYVKRIVLLHSPTEYSDYTELKWGELENIVRKINPEYGNWRYYGYYSQIGICLPPIVAHWSDPGLIYSFIILMIDFTAFSLVFIAYSIVYRRTRRGENGCIIDIGCCCNRYSQRQSSQQNTDASVPSSTTRARSKSLTRDEEDHEMQKRILWIIGTDFACWSPICILTLVAMINPSVEGEKSFVVAMVLVQINSVVNPLVYSRRIRSALKHAVIKFCRMVHSLTFKMLKRRRSVDNCSLSSLGGDRPGCQRTTVPNSGLPPANRSASNDSDYECSVSRTISISDAL